MNNPQIHLIRPRQLAQQLGIARSTLWAYVRSGRLPRPLKLSARITVWKISDIEAFLQELKAAR